MSLSLSFSLSIYLSISLSLYLSVCLTLFLSLSHTHFLCLSHFLYLLPSLSLSLSLWVSLIGKVPDKQNSFGYNISFFAGRSQSCSSVVGRRRRGGKCLLQILRVRHRRVALRRLRIGYVDACDLRRRFYVAIRRKFVASS